VRYGRLAGTALVPPRTDPVPAIDSLRVTGEHVPAPVPPAPAGHPEEADLVLAWLGRPGVRIVSVSTPWAYPVRSAQARTDPSDAVAAGRVTAAESELAAALDDTAPAERDARFTAAAARGSTDARDASGTQGPATEAPGAA
jgi:DNA polymerase-3 subunit epsilon